MRICYDCEQPKEKGHVCVPWAEPKPGTTYRLERFAPDPMGMLGSWSVDVLDASGKSVAGLMFTKEGCERLLVIRGFKPPFVWPTIAESKAARKARRPRR